MAAPRSESSAITALQNSNLAYSIKREPSNDYAAGLVCYQSVKLLYHLLVKIVVVDVHREHTGYITDTQYLLSGEFPVHIALQGDHVVDVRYMRLSV